MISRRSSTSSDGTVKVSHEGRTLLDRHVTQDAIDAVAVLPRGRLLLAEEKPRLAVYDLAEGTQLAAFELAARAQALRVSEDGDRAIVNPVVHHVHTWCCTTFGELD